MILQTIHDERLEQDINVLSKVLPSQEELDEILVELPSNPLDVTLSIVNPLIPPQSLWDEDESRQASFDSAGLSEYARLVYALLSAITHERHLAKANYWFLRHAMCLSLYANDTLQLPGVENAIFSRDVESSVLQSIISRTHMLSAMLLTEVGGRWHETVTKTLATGAGTHLDVVASHVCGIFLKSASNNSIRDARVLYSTLHRLLSEATTSDTEHWMLLSRRFETKGPFKFSTPRERLLIVVLSAPLASEAIILAVAESGLEPPRLDRLRNELAAESLGIKPHRINTDGLRLLHRLGLTVPDPDSDVAFLPQNRAVNFMKACQSWISSLSEDDEEDVESEMLTIFLHLLPILQSVTGAHWDFIFDMVENNLEVCRE